MSRGNGAPQAEAQYVLVPVGVDAGDVATKIGPIAVTMADLDNGLTVVGVPSSTSLAERKSLLDALTGAAGETGVRRKFLVCDGEVGVRWKFWRMIRRDRYDEDFGEAKPQKAKA